MRSRSGRWPAPPRRAARGWCTTDPTSCSRDSTDLTPSRTTSRCRRHRAASTPRRSLSASGWRSNMRARVRAARRKSLRPAGGLDRDGAARSTRSWRASRRVARCRCSPIASSRRVMLKMLRLPRGTSSIPMRAPGLYHCVNSGHGTWHQVALEAARLLGVPPRLKPITTDRGAASRPQRPRFCALSNRKLAAAGFDDAALAGRAATLARVRGRPAA